MKLLKIVLGLTLALALVVGVGAVSASAEGMGDSGAGVSMLQADLISLGYSIPAGATGYYGSQTSAAVSAFQAAYASEILRSEEHTSELQSLTYLLFPLLL